MPQDPHREIRLGFVRKPDLLVLGKVNETGTDCSCICAFYEQCSKENVWGVLNAIPELLTGTRGYYFGKRDDDADGEHCATHMAGIEVPLDFREPLDGMVACPVPAGLYAVFVAVEGNGAPWGEAHAWLAAQSQWVTDDGALPWSEDDGPKGCSLLFVPVAPAGERVVATVHDYPMGNEALAEIGTRIEA